MKKHSRTLSDCWKFIDQKLRCSFDKFANYYDQEDIVIPYFSLESNTPNASNDPSTFTFEESHNLVECFKYLNTVVSFHDFNGVDTFANNVVLIDVFTRRFIDDDWEFDLDNGIRTICIWKIKDDELFIFDPIDHHGTKFLQLFIHQNFPSSKMCLHFCTEFQGGFYAISSESRDNLDIAVKAAMILNNNQSEINYIAIDGKPYNLFPSGKKLSKFIKSLRILSNRYPVNPNLEHHPICNIKKMQSTKILRQREIYNQLSANQFGLFVLKKCDITLNLQYLYKIAFLRDYHHNTILWMEKNFGNYEPTHNTIVRFKSIMDDPSPYEIKKFAKTCFKLFRDGNRALISLLLFVEGENINYFTKLGVANKSSFFIFVHYCLNLELYIFHADDEEQMLLFNDACFIFFRNTPFELLKTTSNCRYSRHIVRFLIDYPHSTFVLNLILKKYPSLVNDPFFDNTYLLNKFVYEKENSATLPNLDILLEHITAETAIKSVDPNKHQLSTLHMVIINGHKNVYKKLLTKFPTLLFDFDKYDQSPFSFLCYKPNDWYELFLWTLKLMESFVADHPTYYKPFQDLISKPNNHGYNCLTLSIQAKNFKNAIKLTERYPHLCRQIDIHDQPIFGWLVFKYCESQHQECIQLFTQFWHYLSTKEMEKRFGELGQTFMMYAFGLRNFKLCDSLIDLVPHFLNISNNKKVLPIHSIAINGHGESQLIEKVLQQMDHSLWMQQTDVKNSNTLHFATRFFNFQAAHILIDYSPDLCIVPDENGFLAMYYLVQYASITFMFPQLWKPVVTTILKLMKVHNLDKEFVTKHQQTISEIDVDNKWFIDIICGIHGNHGIQEYHSMI